MFVLGKPEFKYSVRYDELELLLQNFGVSKGNEDEDLDMLEHSENLNIIEDESVSVNEPIYNKENMSDDGGVLFIDDSRPEF